MPNQRPTPDEFAPHHRRYIDVAPVPVIAGLRAQSIETGGLLRSIRESDAAYRYQPEKWSVRQVAGHLSDAERVYGYRALAMARNDANPLPKYDPDGYVDAAGFDDRTMTSLADEFLAVREQTIRFFENLPPAAWSRRGTMGGNPLSVRALAFIAFGHVQQHLEVLHDRYAIPRFLP